MTAYFLDGSPDGVRVAKVDRKVLHRSMVEGIGEAIRTGIDVELLDGYRAHRAAKDLVLVDRRSTRLKELHSHAAQAHRRAERAMEVAEDAQTTDEEKLARARARKHLDDEARYRQEIGRLEAEASTRTLGDAFDGEVGFLLTGLAGLVSEDGLVTADQASALGCVLDDLRLEASGTTIRWSIRVLIPADGHVISLGPVTGSVPIVGNPAPPAILLHLSSGKAGIAHRRDALDALMDAGYPRVLAAAAALAPAPWLVSALLDQPTRWPRVESDFDHDNFSAYVREHWRRQSAWPANAYAVINPTRQRMVDYVAERGGSVSLDVVLDALPTLGLKRSHLDSMLVGRSTSSGNVMPPVLRKGGEWLRHRNHRSKALIENYTCPSCAGLVTAVVIVPENPCGLLCKACLVPPAMPERTYPGIYADLALQLD